MIDETLISHFTHGGGGGGGDDDDEEKSIFGNSLPQSIFIAPHSIVFPLAAASYDSLSLVIHFRSAIYRTFHSLRHSCMLYHHYRFRKFPIHLNFTRDLCKVKQSRTL
jgi:hypothetical protein